MSASPSILLRALVAAGLAVAIGPAGAADRPVGSLRLIGEQRIAFDTRFAETTVGGLSGMDYDAATGTWYLLSDDRSDKSPARFYTARLAYGADRFDSVEITGVTALKQPDGAPFPNRAASGEVPDPEAFRIDPKGGGLWWTSEGDRRLSLPPTLREASHDGLSKPALPTPARFASDPGREFGARNNAAFEGLSFAADGFTLVVAMEAPVYQDGPLPTPTTGAVTRFIRLDRSGRPLGEYAYPIGAIPAAPGAGKSADNGVSEILATAAQRFLVIERSGVEGADGVWKNYVRLYEVDLAAATDVSGIESLPGAAYTAVGKRLVLDLAGLGLERLDNIEAMAFGPRLANGHDTLVLASDDNFNKTQVTQFLAFEVLP